MSLRLRLSLTLGAAFALIWALAAAWMLSDLRNQMMFSLDQRLVASARMVAGLLEQLPTLPSKGEGTHFSAEQLKDSVYGFSDELESNALNVHIHHLRSKLGKGIVETVRGLGYRLGPADGGDQGK